MPSLPTRPPAGIASTDVSSVVSLRDASREQFFPPADHTAFVIGCTAIVLSFVGMIAGATGLFVRWRRGDFWLVRRRNGRIQPHGTVLIALLISIYLLIIAVTELADLIITSQRRSSVSLVAVRILRHLPITWAACVLAWSAWTSLPTRSSVSDDVKTELIVLGVDSAPRSPRWRFGRLADLGIVLVIVAQTTPIIVWAVWCQIIAFQLDSYQSTVLAVLDDAVTNGTPLSSLVDGRIAARQVYIISGRYIQIVGLCFLFFAVFIALFSIVATPALILCFRVLNAHVARLRQAAHVDSAVDATSGASGVWSPQTMDLDAALSHVPRRSFTAASSRDKLRRMLNVRAVYVSNMVIVALVTLYQFGSNVYGAVHFATLITDPSALALFDVLIIATTSMLCAPQLVLFAVVSLRGHCDPEQVLPGPADALACHSSAQADLMDRFVAPRPPTPFEGDDKDMRVLAQLAEMRKAPSDQPTSMLMPLSSPVAKSP